MSATVDANVLVYASNRSDPAHASALTLIERLAAGPELLYLFWPALVGYLRIVTHPGILPRPLTPAAALGNITALLAPAHVRARAKPRLLDTFQTTAGQRVRGNEVPDAHLAALMRQHGVGRIYTRDRDFRRFDGITVEDPFA